MGGAESVREAASIAGRISVSLVMTNDVDVYADYEYAVAREFARLLAKAGKEVDPLGHEIWMPSETRYGVVFEGRFVTLSIADVDAVLVSKARMAPEKNRAMIVEYLARGASARFLSLAEKYGVDLEAFVR